MKSILLALLLAPALGLAAPAAEVEFLFDSAVPQLAFAGGELRTALKARPTRLLRASN